MKLYEMDFDRWDEEGLSPVYCHRCGTISMLSWWSESRGEDQNLCCDECGCAVNAKLVFEQVFENKFVAVLLEHCTRRDAVEKMVDFYKNNT